jgi:hypothetical protein
MFDIRSSGSDWKRYSDPTGTPARSHTNWLRRAELFQHSLKLFLRSRQLRGSSADDAAAHPLVGAGGESEGERCEETFDCWSQDAANLAEPLIQMAARVMVLELNIVRQRFLRPRWSRHRR